MAERLSLVETDSGLSFVLVQRIGIDLRVASVVDVLGHGITGAASHRAKDDNARGNGADDDSSHDNTGHDSQECEAGLFLGLTGGQRLGAVGDGAGGVGGVQDAVVRLGRAARGERLVAQLDGAEGGGAIRAVLWRDDTALRGVASGVDDARRGGGTEVVVRREGAASAGDADVHRAVDVVVAHFRLLVASASGRVAAQVDVARIGRGRARDVAADAAEHLVTRVHRARIAVVAHSGDRDAAASAWVARVSDAGGVRLRAGPRGVDALEVGIARWHDAQVGRV